MSKSPRVIGVTGGIGSGKTAVTDFFARKGVHIVDADIVARQVVEPGQPALQTIAEHYGSQIIQPDGALNRKKLRGIIFEQNEERLWLESLLHPLIRERILVELQQTSSAYSILVSPLLIETSQKELIDRLLVIDVPVEIQIERTMARDNMTREQTLAIIRKQSTREEKLQAADDVVDNSLSLEHLYQQLEKLHEIYLDQGTSRMSQKKQSIKACPVVLRNTKHSKEILVFRHPLAGIQLVKGTVEKEESIPDAALRELKEESGIRAASIIRNLGSWQATDNEQTWHFFICEVPKLPNTWKHFTKDDGGHEFSFFWHPLKEPTSSEWHPIFVKALRFIKSHI